MEPLARVAALGRRQAGRLGLAVLAGAAAGGAAIGLSATSAWLLSRAAQQPPVLYLMVAVTGVRAFGIARGVLRYLERLAAHDAAFRILGDLRLAAYGRLERLAPAGLEAFRSGDLLSRLVGDIDGLADIWLRLLLPYAVALVGGAGACLLVAALVPPAGLVLAATLAVVAFGVPLLVAAVARRAESSLAPERGRLAAASLDLVRGGPELTAAGSLAGPLAELAAIDGRLAAAEARSATGAGVGSFAAGLASGVAVWFALVAGILAVRAGRLDGVALAVVVLTPIAAHEAVAGLVSAAEHVPRLAGGAARLVDVLRRPDPVLEPAAPAAPPAGPLGLRLAGLAARYGPGGPEVLRGVDLDVPAGGRALVVGPSGSGKSTLAAVLLRFLEPAAGTAELVAMGTTVALASLSGDEVRRIVGCAAQEPHIFDTSIAENLRLARPGAALDELRDALRRVRLLDWVDGLPLGIDTLVGEHGRQLSGGQRQRLSLARTVLAERRLLVLDEPTEHLDEAMAAAVMADVLASAAGCTVIVLTHRPELLPEDGWSVRLDLGREAAALADGSPRPSAVSPPPGFATEPAPELAGGVG